MSLAFYGAFTAIFYTIVLGSIWPMRSDTDLSTSLLDLIAKSLWLSWLIVVLSYFFNLPNLIKPLCIGVAATVAVQSIWSRRVAIGAEARFALFGALLLSAFLYFGGFGSDYRLVFVTNDAVDSWNRWAVDLARNEYRPYDAAYPILFPGLWSLIYKAQQSASVWIFAKGTLFLLVFILFLLVSQLLRCGLVLCAGMLAGIGGLFLIYWHAFPLLNGDMDIPVSVMSVATCVSILIAAHHLENKSVEVRDAIILSALFTGLAVITKQPGIVLLLPFGMLLGFALWVKAIKPGSAIVASLVALLPLAGFLAMYLSKQINPIGNVGRLRALTVAAAKNDHPIGLAAGHLFNAIPAWALVLIIACGLMNFMDVRRLTSWIGFALLTLSIVGFLQYAMCCGYDERNVWWTIALALGSALFGLRNLDGVTVTGVVSLWPAALVRGVVIALAILAGFAVSSRVSDATIAEVQVREQFGMLGAAGPMVRSKFLTIQKKEDVLVTEMNVVKWTPGMISRVQLCGSAHHECMVEAAKSALNGRLFVFIARGWLEYPAIAHMLAENRLLGKANQFELYGPFEAAEFTGARSGGP